MPVLKHNVIEVALDIQCCSFSIISSAVNYLLTVNQTTVLPCFVQTKQNIHVVGLRILESALVIVESHYTITASET